MYHQPSSAELDFKVTFHHYFQSMDWLFLNQEIEIKCKTCLNPGLALISSWATSWSDHNCNANIAVSLMLSKWCMKQKDLHRKGYISYHQYSVKYSHVSWRQLNCKHYQRWQTQRLVPIESIKAIFILRWNYTFQQQVFISINLHIADYSSSNQKAFQFHSIHGFF